MEPENQHLEKEIPGFGNHDFQVPAVKLWGCKASGLFWNVWKILENSISF